MNRNPICWDCGKKLSWDTAVAVPYDKQTIYLCYRCYRAPLAAVRNPYPQVCGNCGAVIYATITPVKCPRCGKPWKEKNPKKVYRTIKTFHSKSDPSKSYTVKRDEQGNLGCNCPIWVFKRWGVRDCPHIRIVKTEGRHLVENPIKNRKMKHSLELHREYIGLQDKPIFEMTDRELQVVRTETPSFKELEQVEYELKKRGKIKLTGMESFTKMTGGKIIFDENPKRKPTTIERTGNILGGMGILAIPVITGLVLWIQSKVKE